MTEQSMHIASSEEQKASRSGDTIQRIFTEKEKIDVVNKDRFYKKLAEFYKDRTNKRPFTRESLNALLDEVQIAKGKRFRKDRREYFVLRTYDVKKIDGKPQVIRKKDGLPVIAFEDLYDIIFDFHVRTKHGGKTKLEIAFKQGKVNIPRPATEIFLICCTICLARRNTPRKTHVEKPKYVKGFSHKGQVDTVDFHSIPDGYYNTVLSYQDHYTKFMVLRPLENDAPEVIAAELLNIFMLIGAPKVLESHNGKYFVTKILNHINGMWSEKIVAYGEPKETESPSKRPEEIECSIRKWMEANMTMKWSKGLNSVQWQANVTHNQIVGRCPYHALFGFIPRLQLIPNSSLSTSDDIIPNSMKQNGYTVEDPGSTETLHYAAHATEYSDEEIKPEISSSDGDISLDFQGVERTLGKQCGHCDNSINDSTCENISSICDSDSENSPFKRFKKEAEETLVE